MDISADKFISEANQTNSFFSWVKAVIIKTRRLIGFFNLTEEDRIKAGIYSDDN